MLTKDMVGHDVNREIRQEKGTHVSPGFGGNAISEGREQFQVFLLWWEGEIE